MDFLGESLNWGNLRASLHVKLKRKKTKSVYYSASLQLNKGFRFTGRRIDSCYLTAFLKDMHRPRKKSPLKTGRKLLFQNEIYYFDAPETDLKKKSQTECGESLRQNSIHVVTEQNKLRCQSVKIALFLAVSVFQLITSLKRCVCWNCDPHDFPVLHVVCWHRPARAGWKIKLFISSPRVSTQLAQTYDTTKL